MKFSFEAVSIKVISFMKIKRKGFVMKRGKTHSASDGVLWVNVSRRMDGFFFLNFSQNQPHNISHWNLCCSVCRLC